MKDISIMDRRKLIGQRLREERIQAGLTQEQLAEKLTSALNLEFHCKDIAQSTIVHWESGNTNIPLDRLIAISKIFQCDCGYLLCDYDQRTHNSLEICGTIGLSESSVNHLSALRTWGITSEAKTLDFLLQDARERHRSHNYRSILDLLRFFLEYDDSGTKTKQVFSNGYVSDYEGGGIATNAIALNSRIVENAALMEMEQALISLKKLYKEGKKEENG